MLLNILGLKYYGDRAAREITEQFGGVAADVADIKTITPKFRRDGMLVMEKTRGGLWMFGDALAATEDTAQELILTPDDAPSAGRWKRADKHFNLHVPVNSTLADGAAAETIPAGFVLRLNGHGYWNIATAFTGGSSPAIGISTNITGYETGGDLLGGATGDVAATLTAGVKAGTQGGELVDEAAFHDLLFVEDGEFQYDRINDAFAAGAGFAVFPVAVDWIAES